MKYLLFALFIAFTLLMGYTIHQAIMVYNGPVESQYYEHSRRFFTRRDEEKANQIELHIEQPQWHLGTNTLLLKAYRKSEPLNGGRATLRMVPLSRQSSGTQLVVARESQPGEYAFECTINSLGGWRMNLILTSDQQEWERSWIITLK